MTWLGALNFLVLQWFGVRLARVTVTEWAPPRVTSIESGRVTYGRAFEQRERVIVLRWIVPLTGWWSDFRYIARPGNAR